MLRIADFGFAKRLPYTAEEFGTVPYMVPEVLRGDSPSFSIDIWAVGVIYFEMVVGGRPFYGNRTEMEFQVMMNSYRILKSVPKVMAGLIERLLRHNPRKRPCLNQILKHRFMIPSLPSHHQYPQPFMQVMRDAFHRLLPVAA